MFKKLFNRLIESAVQKRVTEYFLKGGFNIDRDPSDPPGTYYRRLSGKTEKDLTPLTHERMLHMVYYLYQTNPLAHRIIELTKDFVIGSGITYQASGRTQVLLDQFWYDPVNNWDLKQHQKALELGLYGEQIYPVQVNPVDGHVRLGYIDPLQVSEVVLDPENCEIAIGIILKGQGGAPGAKLQVILADNLNQPQRHGDTEKTEAPTILSPAARTLYNTFTDGRCFYFAVNKVSNAARGTSDLLPFIDWLDGYDQLLFNRIDRAALINAFVWDVTLENMTEEEIQAWLKANPAPKPGSIRAHNEKVKWQAVAPELHASDTSEEARLLRNHIVGNAGFPEHWFGEGGDVNRATAVEMGAPTFRKLVARQNYFKAMLEQIFDFALHQARSVGAIHELPLQREYQIVMDEVSVKDMQRNTSSLLSLTTALNLAISQGLIDGEQAREIFAKYLGEIGYEVEEPAEQPAGGDNGDGRVIDLYKRANVGAVREPPVTGGNRDGNL